MRSRLPRDMMMRVITHSREAASLLCVLAFAHVGSARLLLYEGFNQPALPGGWTVSNGSWLSFVHASTQPAAAPFENTHCVKFGSHHAPSGTRTLLVSPPVSTIGKTNVKVSFAWHRDPGFASEDDRVIVRWSLNGTNWFGTNTFLRYAPDTGWIVHTISLPHATTNQASVYVGFDFVSAYGNNCYLDAVRIEATAPDEVEPPRELVAVGMGLTHINLQWLTNAAGDTVMIAQSSESSFGTPSNGVAYAVGDVLAGGGTVVFCGNQLALTLTGLLPGTRYYFRAWSVNSLTNYSDGIDANATTDFLLPIYEGFNTLATPAGWNISNAPYLGMVPESIFPHAMPYEGTHFVRFLSYNAPSGTQATLVSPRFSTHNGLASVFIDFAWHQDPVFPTFDDSVTVEWSSNGLHWGAAQTLGRVGVQTGWTRQRVQLPAAIVGHPRAQVRFRFLSAFGYNCYLDNVRILPAEPNVHIYPTPVANSAGPGVAAAYSLFIVNLTGADRDVQLEYDSPWTVTSPPTTGTITNNETANITVHVHVPHRAIDLQSATTIVYAITTDGSFTNVAYLVTTCRWIAQPVCEWFESVLRLRQWTNFFFGGKNSGWYWDSWYLAAAHDQEEGGTNWLVSPAIDLNHPWAESIRLRFSFGLEEPLLYPQAACLVVGNRNPMLGQLTRLADMQYDPGFWQLNEADVSAYVTNVPVYLAFEYVSTNPWQLLTGVCIDAWKSGIDNALIVGPAVLPPMISYSSTPAITGAVYILGESGSSGPAASVSAQIGFGPQGTWPSDDLWTWYPATYIGSEDAHDLFVATPYLTIAGRLQYCYRFRRGAAPWVYADTDGSYNGITTNTLGTVVAEQRPPRGGLLREQPISVNYSYAPSSDLDASATPPVYTETADDLVLPYDALVHSLRFGGVYWSAGRQNLEQGFWLRIYAHAHTSPGVLLHEQYVPGYAGEEWLGFDLLGAPYYRYHVDVSTPFYLPAGSRCWFALQHVVSNGTRWSVLDTPDPVHGYGACQRLGSADSWVTLGGGIYDLGMQVYGDATNVGAISGTVRDARELTPIHGAQVTISNAMHINTVVTDSNGFYQIPAASGVYHLRVTKANYLPATVEGLEVSLGITVTQDFLLNGSHVRVAPTNVMRTMAWGQVTTNALVLTNTGPLGVHYTVRVVNFSAITTSAERLTRVSLPPCDGAFPRGTAPLSLGRAPRGKTTIVPAPELLMALPSSVQAYCFNIYPADPNTLITLTTDNPADATTVGPAYVGANSFVCGATFLNRDFSQLYCLVSGANRLVKVNTANAAVMLIGSCNPDGGESWTGLAADPVSGTLYASAHGRISKLYRINRTTGAASLVGPITGSTLIIGIAINADGDMYGLDIGGDTLVRIDKCTGATTTVGSIGYDANYAQDLAFDLQHNVLYIAAYNNATSRGELRVADTTTGNTMLIGPFTSRAIEVDGFATMTAVGTRWAQVSTNAGAVLPGGVANLNVVFDAGVVSNFGEYTAQLRFEGTFVNQPSLVPLKMVVPAGPVINAPSALNFGEVSVGDMTNLTLLIRNVGAGVLSGQITAVSAPFSVMGTASYTIPGGGLSMHTISFAPSVEGVYTNIAILTGGGDATVTLVGTGIPEPGLWLALLLLGMYRLRR